MCSSLWLFISILLFILLLDFIPFGLVKFALLCELEWHRIVFCFSLTTASRNKFLDMLMLIRVPALVENKTTNKKHLVYLTTFTSDGAAHWANASATDRYMRDVGDTLRNGWINNVNREHSTVHHIAPPTAQGNLLQCWRHFQPEKSRWCWWASVCVCIRCT